MMILVRLTRGLSPYTSNMVAVLFYYGLWAFITLTFFYRALPINHRVRFSPFMNDFPNQEFNSKHEIMFSGLLVGKLFPPPQQNRNINSI